ncbi:hypothetical protein FHS29_006613 [Saccharothrix tamanrassetensis]|uniref:Transposase n=1 Tax=Saccharothrix tamanrassetensis TaxID=1051531 RepID=A0A841CQJ2_9PSEU|nr:hypothetical protein [Saccharothrix tamanrassetensis]
MGDRLVEQIWTALDEQTVTVPGTTAADTVLPRLADSLKTVLHQRISVADEVEGMLDAHRLVPVTRRSGSSIKGEHPARTGNRKLEARSSSPPSQPTPTRPAAPTTSANATRRRNTTPRSAWPDDAATSCPPYLHQNPRPTTRPAPTPAAA